MVGTGPDSFDRLVRPLDELAGKHGWDAFVQLGHTSYEPVHCRFERFVERDILLRMIESAELVVMQGGYGGIRDALLFNKPIVAVPRYPGLHEAPDHQDEMVRAMEQQGYLIGVYDIDNLEAAIAAARSFVPVPRQISRIPEMLNDYLVTCQDSAKELG
jgi:UDP-N-acetylglucosamine transferase subunit ALG13